MSPFAHRSTPYTGAPAGRWWFASMLRVSLAHVVAGAFRTRAIGRERLPEGGMILAGNHASYLDPVLLWCKSPRPVHFVAKAELWDIKLLGWLLERLWAFPVKRGTADREMITTAGALLAAGEPIGMFPEGTRRADDEGEELGEFHGGVAFLAIRAGVPVVPVGIAGTDKAWPKGKMLPRFVRVTMVFGEPIDPAQFEGGRKERVEALTAVLAQRIEAARAQAKEA